ncbi:MAG: MFS transporter [Helicobacteraceae bacterium]|nr:MFS transporter [Helicobacteraceae bacterium]
MREVKVQESLLKQSLPLSLIMASRFFGLFIVMPVLSLYALSLENTSPILVGIVMGGYALTQVLFQVPFGILSDKFGRKGIIALGLVIFALGSLICALSDNIYLLILGRLLQGAGAVGGVVSAMIADLVKEERRTKAMALMGATISLSFTAALILGPILASSFGVASLFLITFILAIVALFIIFFLVPNAPKITYNFDHHAKDYQSILKNKNLQIMNLSNFLQKGLMTLALLMIPIALVKGFSMPEANLWQVYVPASILGFLSMAPAAIMAEKKGYFKGVMVVGILLFAFAYLSMMCPSKWVFILGVLVFFIGFSVHEPIMQSLASRYCKAHLKGSAMGVFTTFGYFGSFVGALLGGHLYYFFGLVSIGIVVAITCALWVILMYFLDSPIIHKMLYVPLDKNPNADALKGLSGILEYYINESEKVLVIKYNKDSIKEEQILTLLLPIR